MGTDIQKLSFDIPRRPRVLMGVGTRFRRRVTRLSLRLGGALLYQSWRRLCLGAPLCRVAQSSLRPGPRGMWRSDWGCSGQVEMCQITKMSHLSQQWSWCCIMGEWGVPEAHAVKTLHLAFFLWKVKQLHELSNSQGKKILFFFNRAASN